MKVKELKGMVLAPKQKEFGSPEYEVKGINVFETTWPLLAHLYKYCGNCKDKKTFNTELNGWLRSELGARAEGELVVGPLFGENNGIKIDPFQQLEANGDKFLDYCGKNKDLFKGKHFKECNDRLEDLYKYYRGDK